MKHLLGAGVTSALGAFAAHIDNELHDENRYDEDRLPLTKSQKDVWVGCGAAAGVVLYFAGLGSLKLLKSRPWFFLSLGAGAAAAGGLVVIGNASEMVDASTKGRSPVRVQYPKVMAQGAAFGAVTYASCAAIRS